MRKFKREPRTGEQRLVFKFLILPKTLQTRYCDQTETRWMCRAGIIQERKGPFSGKSKPYWKDICFLDEDLLKYFVENFQEKPVYEPDKQL